jgi:rhodanese-related sulfurtransferase
MVNKKRSKRSKDSHASILVWAILLGIVSGVVASFFFVNYYTPSEDRLIKEFYEVENAVHISPHGLRKHLGEDPNVVIVDLRSGEEYETAHITSAISIPAYATPDKSDYGAIERITKSFRAIYDENPDAEVIVYCYSGPCMTGRKIGKMLAEHGMYVKHLGIGWSEWRYYWNMWNHDGETQVDPTEFITSGPEPGKLDKSLVGAGCPIEGGFGC